MGKRSLKRRNTLFEADSLVMQPVWLMQVLRFAKPSEETPLGRLWESLWYV